jgi:Putative Flp pilus-assembly TadE/G-like
MYRRLGMDAVRRRTKRATALGALRGRKKHERGAVAVVVAVSLVALLGMAALAIDLSSFYQAQRQAQSAADSAALAAAQDLPSASSADGNATTYGLENDPGSTVAATTPYSSSSNEIMVKVTKTSPTFFGQIFGIPSETVSASAVAGPSSGAGYDAIFASDTSCTGTANATGVAITSSTVSINGGVESDGYLSVTGGSDALGATTYGGPNSCAKNVTGSGDTFTSGPTANNTTIPWPFDYTSYGTNTSNCTSTYSGTGTLTLPASGTTIAPGVYCAPNGTISISAANVTGTGVTLIANAFSLTGSPLSLTPAAGANGLLIYQSGSAELDLKSSGLLQGGTVFAPNAFVRESGSGIDSGFIEAKDVRISGSGFTFTGTGPSVGGVGSITLLQ